jgi:predicted enzyme related to lactoylglutathione lyase
MPIPPLRGRFVWHELMTTDTKSAAAFYTKLVGWKTKPFDQNPGYTMFTVESRPMAGLMALPEPDSPLTWLAYIGTPNVDETARQAEGLGGKVLKKPTDIPTIGRFAIIQDPQGALFVAFTPLPTQGSAAPDLTPAIGDFSWHELVTTDWRGALAFYKTLFGWEETDSMDMGPEMGTYQMYGWKGHMLGGMMNKPRQSPGPPAWLSYIHVADAKTAAATVKRLGGQIINGPMEVPGGTWIAAGLDLQGAAFAVHSAKPSSKKSKPRKAKPARRAAAPKAVKKKTAARKTRPVKKKAAAKKRKRAGSKK